MNIRVCRPISWMIPVGALLLSGCGKKASVPSETRETGRKFTPGDKQVSTTAESTKKATGQRPVAELEKSWHDLKRQDLPERERLLRQRKIIEQLTLQGNFEEAKRLAFTYGEGSNRATMIFALFSKNPASLEAMLSLAQDGSFAKGEMYAVYNGISRNVAQPGGLDKALTLIHSGHKFSNEEALAITKGLGAAIDSDEAELTHHPDPEFTGVGRTEAEMESKYQEVEGVLRSLGNASPETKDRVVDIFLGMAVRSMPFDAWRTLMENYDSLDKSIRSKRASGLAEVMFVRSPERALSALTELRGKTDISNLYGLGFDAWMDSDISAAQDWYKENKANLSQQETDQISAAAATQFKNRSQLEEARKWLEEIKDPATKQKVSGQIWETERTALRKDVEKDPSGTITAILGGKSQYGDYWLEEAMGKWVEKDFDKAEGWYEKNWNSLPQQKSQYLAAAFANHALNQGDPAVAAQWMTFIQDPKTKQRIQDRIDKAATHVGK